jgi:anti-sigma regulatory factor (Ser/Thr protein kinase)
VTAAGADGVGPAHDGFVFTSDEQLVRFAVPFLREGLERQEAAVVVVGERARQLLAPALEGVGPVVFVSPPEVFRRTPRALLAYQELVEQALADGAAGVRAVSEVDFGDNDYARTESVRFEAVANLALAQHPLWNVCLYDVRRTPAELLSTSTQAHPYLVNDQQRRRNPDFIPPAELLRRHSQVSPYRVEAEAPDLEVQDLRPVGLAGLRTAVNDAAASDSVLPAGQIDDFLEAVTEVATNALRHGEGPVHIRMWVTQQRLVMTVTDRGAGFDDPLAGFLPPLIEALPVNGSGLWLARNLSDSLDFSRTTSGFIARIACWTS